MNGNGDKIKVEEELTGQQSGTTQGITVLKTDPNFVGNAASTAGTLLTTAIYGGPLLSWDDAPLGTYQTYRDMMRHPTIAIARAIVKAPIISADWSIEVADTDVPDEWVEFIDSVFEPIRSGLLRQLLYALDFGYRGFEKIFTLDGRYITLKKLKPLRPEMTEILVDEETGEFVGFKQNDVIVPEPKSMIYINEMEDDDYYGYSRHENIRQQWWAWKKMNGNVGQLGNKVSSIIPIIMHPPGDANEKMSNHEAAKTLAQGLASGKPIVMENLFAAAEDISRFPELAKASSWHVDTVDVGGASDSFGGMLEWSKYYDALMMRGWIRPERSALEGQFGTKAEAAVHADIGLADSERLHVDLVRAINRQIVNQLLFLNFGPEAVDQVYVKPSPMLDQDREVFLKIFQALLNPATLDLLLQAIDVDAVLDNLGVPKTQSVIEVTRPPEPAGERTPAPAREDEDE